MEVYLIDKRLIINIMAFFCKPIFQTICAISIGIIITVISKRRLSTVFKLKTALFIMLIPLLYFLFVMLIDSDFSQPSVFKSLLEFSIYYLFAFTAVYSCLFIVNEVSLFVLAIIQSIRQKNLKIYDNKVFIALLIIIASICLYFPYMELLGRAYYAVNNIAFPPLYYGCVDKKGKVIIEPKYLGKLHFINGLAFIWIGGKYGAIDRNEKVVIKPQFDDVKYPRDEWQYLEDYFLVKVGNYWGYIGKTGKTVIKPQFKNAENFFDGLASVTLDGEKWGYIDRTGKFIIKPQFNQSSDFYKGKAYVEIGNKKFVIDKKGKRNKYKELFESNPDKVTIKPEYKIIDYSHTISEMNIPCVIIGNTSDYYCEVKDNKLGLKDKKDHTIIKPEYDCIDLINKDMIKVCKNKKCGVTDKTGKVIIDLKYDGIYDAGEGLIGIVLRKRGWGF